MPANHQQRACDERLLRGYLEDELSEEEQLLVETHLCQCERCRNLIRDSAVAWDATADEIERLLQDARSFESQAQQFWGTQTTDPTVAPDSESPLTSEQESNP